MSDVDGIFDKPPSQDNSRVIHTFIPSDLSKIEFGAKSNVGTGGNNCYILQWNLDLRKILGVTKIFLKSRFFFISNTRNPS
jgi:glutamate 5-kinase